MTSFAIFMNQNERLARQAEEIEKIRRKLDIDYRELALSIAVKPDTMRKIAKGYQPASARVMQSLRALAVAWPPEPVKGGATYKPHRVPVVSWAAAGQAHDYGDLAGQIDEFIDSDLRDPSAFALIVEGDSMNPRIEAGDKVVVSPASEPRNGDIVVARLREDRGVLIKLYRRTGPEGKTIKLESLNPLYKSQIFPSTAFLWIYPVIEFRGRLRKA